MRRTLILLYGFAAYAIGMLSLLYMVGWLGNFGVPKSIDSTPTASIGIALAVNLGVFLLFCVQHSVMARPRFKAWWTRWIPEAAERSSYVLFSAVALFVCMLGWQPLGGQVWLVEDPNGQFALYALYAMGWAILVGSTFALNHFDLFGLRQVWLQFRGLPYEPLEFSTPGPYRWVRHPLYVGWLTLAWATPYMTLAHLAFALFTTFYILLAIRWEEKDLVDFHGEKYLEYRRQTPMLIPSPKPSLSEEKLTSSATRVAK